MRSRITLLFSALCTTLLTLVAAPAQAAPEAKILRIDPRAQNGGTPVVTTVVEVAQHKRLSDVIGSCAYKSGDAALECMAQALAQPRALFTPFPFPKDNALFTILVDGAETPTKFVDMYQWGTSQQIAGVGTAWLIILDAGGSMGVEFREAQATATAFVNGLSGQDIADVMVVGNNQATVADSHWKTVAQKADLLGTISSARAMSADGRARPLFTTIKNAATDAFKDLGNAGNATPVPLHQAMVVLSNGEAGADTLTNGAGATQLSQYLTQGRFPEDNQSLPKTPLPVISVLFPTHGISEEFTKNATDFMTNLANTDIGGYFAVVRGGGATLGPQIVNAVRDRFNQMWVVRWRVSCVAPTVLQSFNLLFNNVNPQIAPDGSFKNVPIGIDPTTWPLDVDVAVSGQQAKAKPVEPGGTFTVYGDFCWGSNKDRAQVYFIPAGTNPPAQVSMNDIAAAKRTQQQLISMKMDGTTVKVTDTTATFTAPDNDKILIGKGEPAIVRVVVYDNVAKRMSGATATTILSLKGSEKSFPLVWIIAGAFGGVVIILLLVAIARGGGGGGKKRGGNPPPAPVPPPAGGGMGGPPGGWQPPGGGGPPPGYGGGAPPGGGYGGPPGGGYGGPPGGGGPPPGYGSSGQPPMNGGIASVSGPAGTSLAGPPAGQAASSDFLYGGKPPQYGLTTGQPVNGAPLPADPYAQAGAPPAVNGHGPSRATLAGAVGTFTVLPGVEMRAGRDAAQCQIMFNEPRVSGVHATVKLEQGQLVVRDENSNNGTHVNGVRIHAGAWTPVPPGSMLRFGPVELSVRLE